MRSQLVFRAASVLAVALLVGGAVSRADDREDRDRKARAALALTAPLAPKSAAAPKPREVGADYQAAYARALEQSKPLVVYVACKADHKAPDAIPAKIDAMPGVKGPAAVVMYPRGNGMLVHRVLQCPVDDSELGKAIKDATKKSGAPTSAKSDDKAAPRPLDWHIRHELPEDRPARSYRLPAKLPEAQMTTMTHAEMSKWRAKCPASTVNTMLAGRVIDTRGGGEEVLSPWTLYVSTFADVDAAVARAKSGEMAEVRPSIVIRIGETPIYLNGELFDPRDCRWFPEGHEGEPHHEFLRWYAYTGACRIDKRPGGGWDFTSLEGAVRDAAYRGGGAEPDAPHILANYFKHEIRSLKECRAMWAKETPQEDREFVARQPARVQVRRAAPVSSRTEARTELDVLRDASVRVWCGDAGGSGTVVFAEPGRSVVLTAAHVVEHGAAVTVRAEGRTLPAKVLLTDRAADLCALEVRRELPAVVSVSDEWDAGDDVLMIGGSSIWSKGKARGTEQLNDRPNLLADYESISGDSGGGVFVRGSLVAVHVGRYGNRARCPCKLTAFVARAIHPNASSRPAYLPEPAPKVTKAAPDCPNGNCPLLASASPFAGPVVISGTGGCANGQCDLPSYGRGGLFRRR